MWILPKLINRHPLICKRQREYIELVRDIKGGKILLKFMLLRFLYFSNIELGV